MDREFVYTKERLLEILGHVLERDVRDREEYERVERAEEGFEKRAVLEFVLWFLEEAFPQNFSFRCRFDELEQDYPPEVARRIAEGSGWTEAPPEDEGGEARNVVHVDFRKRRGDDGSD